MAEEDSFEVRKQHLLASYFDLCSAKELENYLVKYQIIHVCFAYYGLYCHLDMPISVCGCVQS